MSAPNRKGAAAGIYHLWRPFSRRSMSVAGSSSNEIIIVGARVDFTITTGGSRRRHATGSGRAIKPRSRVSRRPRASAASGGMSRDFRHLKLKLGPRGAGPEECRSLNANLLGESRSLHFDVCNPNLSFLRLLLPLPANELERRCYAIA